MTAIRKGTFGFALLVLNALCGYSVQGELVGAPGLGTKRATEIFSMIRQGELQKLEELDRQGVRFDVLDESGAGPLLVAVENNQLEIVKFLLSQSETDPNVVRVVQRSLIEVALAAKDPSVVNALLEDPRLKGVAPGGLEEKLKELKNRNIEFSLSFDIASDGIRSPSLTVTSHGNRVVDSRRLNQLLEFTAEDRRVKDSTALEVALGQGFVDIVFLLLDDSRVNVTELTQFSMFEAFASFLVRAEKPEIERLLKDSRFDLNNKMAFGMSLASAFLEGDQVDLLDYIINHPTFELTEAVKIELLRQSSLLGSSIFFRQFYQDPRFKSVLSPELRDELFLRISSTTNRELILFVLSLEEFNLFDRRDNGPSILEMVFWGQEFRFFQIVLQSAIPIDDKMKMIEILSPKIDEELKKGEFSSFDRRVNLEFLRESFRDFVNEKSTKGADSVLRGSQWD